MARGPRPSPYDQRRLPIRFPNRYVLPTSASIRILLFWKSITTSESPIMK
jgi:hypothetical protein